MLSFISTPPCRPRNIAMAVAAVAFFVGGCATPDRPAATNFPTPAGTDRYVQAVSKLQAGDQEAAIAELEQALVVNPSLRMARMTLGELYVERKQFEKALPHLEVAAEIDPYTLRNHYHLGLSLQVVNRLQDSAIAYLRGLRLDPDDFKSNMNVGLVYFALGQLDASIYHLEKATRVEPDNPRAWSNIGVVYDARGNLVFAEASYRKALELDSDNESTLRNLTANLITQNKGTDAVAVATRWVNVSDTPLTRKRLGDACTTARRWDEALAAYDAALRADPAFLPALNAKAEMYITRYESDLRLEGTLREKALATWQASLKLQGDQPGVVENVRRWSDPKVFK